MNTPKRISEVTLLMIIFAMAINSCSHRSINQMTFPSNQCIYYHTWDNVDTSSFELVIQVFAQRGNKFMLLDDASILIRTEDGDTIQKIPSINGQIEHNIKLNQHNFSVFISRPGYESLDLHFQIPHFSQSHLFDFYLEKGNETKKYFIH